MNSSKLSKSSYGFLLLILLCFEIAKANDTLFLYGDVGPAPDYPIIGYHMITSSLHSKTSAESGDGGSPLLDFGMSSC